MLKLVRNPELDGVKLTKTDSNIITTKNGIKITNFIGDDGNEYEKAEYPSGTIKWLKA